MTTFTFAPSRERNSNPVMETIMNPLYQAARAPRWLLAAGMALSTALMPLTIAPANAQVPGGMEPRIELEPLEPVEPAPEREKLVPFFEKTGRQLDCDYVQYRLRFGVRGDPAMIGHPILATLLDNVRFDLQDQLPGDLAIVDVSISGDITGPGGGAAPSHTVGTTATPDDSLSLADFRVSAADLDGDGSLTERYAIIEIKAKIDQAAFPAVTNVDNQGNITLQRADVGGGLGTMPSHDPAIPDDGDWKTGAPTTIAIDVTDCEPPPPPPGGDPEEACFAVETGEVDCVPGGGAYIYRMHVGPEMAGNVVMVSSTTPGIVIDPASQVVPAGGGTLEWKIIGALPGETVHLVVTGVETYAGPAEGVGLCCSQTVDIEIPEDLDCPDEEGEPDIKVEKRADEAMCEPEGPCDFTIRVSNAGDAPYTGKIVLGEVTAPGHADIIAGPNAPWTCVPMASPASCEHPETTLNPGEFVDLKLGFQPGPAWPGSVLRNCAEYDYTASGKDAFGDPTNDKACASIKICKPGDPECTPPEGDTPDIGMRKRAEPAVCTPDGLCTYVVTVYNAGPANIAAPITVVDTFPLGDVASASFSPTPPWACVPLAGNQFECKHPMLVLAPGATTDIQVTAVVADYPSNMVENCAKVEALTGETNLANNEACAKATIPDRPGGEPQLRIQKTCEATVSSGSVACRITVSNPGTAAPMGPVRVNDAATLIGGGAPVEIGSVSPDGPEWTCGAVPAATLACEIPGAVMMPGTSRHFDVTVNVSPNERFENCARGSFGPAPGDDIVYPFGEACAEGGTGISVEKTGDSQCLLGQPCTFEITITNDGPAAISGPMRIGDALTVEGFGSTPATIVSVNPPFGCSPEPSELPFVCETTLGLAPGESRSHEVTVELPLDADLASEVGNGAQGRNCAAVIGTDVDVREGPRSLSEPAGEASSRPFDCHDFTVLADEEEEQCSPGFVLNNDGRCVCPEGTTFRNGQCVGDIQTTPIPVPTPRPNRPDPQPKQPERPRPQADPQCKLLPGQIRTQDGRCICPRGTRLQNGRCVKPQVQRECPQGTTGRYPNCRPVVQERCPPGTAFVAGRCRRPEVQRECPPGTTGRYPNCAPIVRPRCPQGTTGTFPNCRPTVQRRCPQGTTGQYPNCRPVEQRRCPPGTTGQYPNCRQTTPPTVTRPPQVTRPPVQRQVPQLNRPQLQIRPQLLLRPRTDQQVQ